MELRRHRSGAGRAGAALAALIGVAACVGSIGGGGDEADGVQKAPLSCDSPLNAMDHPLRRLTKYEYVRTLRALLGDEAVDAVTGAIAQLPSDRTSVALESLSQDIAANHVRGHFAVAEALADYFASAPAARAILAPCLTSSLDAVCVETMLRALGPRVYRRPLGEDEISGLLALRAEGAGTDPESGFKMALSALLVAPPMLFKLELEGEETDGILLLGPEEVANRLAYYLWGAPPDDELRAAAAAGDLDTADGIVEQAERMLADPRAREHLNHFVTQWLLIDHEVDVENLPDYLTEGLPLEGLNEAAQDEVAQLVDALVWEKEAGLFQLLTTTQGSAAHPGLASIYGVPPADDFVELPKERAGLLTRLFFVGDAAGVAHPIHRGVRIRRQLLCGDLELPDPDALPADATDDPPFDPNASTRDRFDEKTSAPECAGCHQLINPLGNAFGHYDGLGRFVSEESIFDADGTLIATIPIDSRVDPMLDGSPGATIEGGVALAAAIAGSPTAQRCVARQWFWHSIGRKDGHSDSCAIDALEDPIAGQDGSIIAMVRAFVSTPQFRNKTLRASEETSKP